MAGWSFPSSSRVRLKIQKVLIEYILLGRLFFQFTGSIAYDTMTRKKLKALWRKLDELRRSPHKAIAVQRFARQLGRRKVKRGKEPNWESDAFPNLRPLSIPDHGGKDLSIGTKNSILNQLEDDLICWEELVTRQEEEAKTKGMK